MHAKMIALGAIIVLILAIVILEMAVFGNHEDMAEVEYEEYQIKIDYNKLAKGIWGLFDGNSHSARKHAPQKEQSNKDTGSADNQALTIQPAPTAPTLPTIPIFGEE